MRVRPVLTAALAAAALAAALPAAAEAGRCGDQACRADVSVSGHAEPQPVRVGEESELKISPKNNGPDGALRIDLQVTVPHQLRILSVRNFGGNGCTVDGTFVRCDLGDFAREQMAVVRIRVRATEVGTFVARAKVYSSDVIDGNWGNNEVGATVGVLRGTGGSGGTTSRPRLSVADRQRLVTNGGLRAFVTARRSGTHRTSATVYTPSGRVSLASVTRSIRRGRRARVWLGARPDGLERIRRALRTRSRLRATVRVRTRGVTVRRTVYVRR